MKMTRFGFGLDLFKFSRGISVSGILVSIVGVIGGISLIVIAYLYDLLPFYGVGAIILIISIPYLVMWILLHIKINKEDIPGIEK